MADYRDSDMNEETIRAEAFEAGVKFGQDEVIRRILRWMVDAARQQMSSEEIHRRDDILKAVEDLFPDAAKRTLARIPLPEPPKDKP